MFLLNLFSKFIYYYWFIFWICFKVVNTINENVVYRTSISYTSITIHIRWSMENIRYIYEIYWSIRYCIDCFSRCSHLITRKAVKINVHELTMLSVRKDMVVEYVINYNYIDLWHYQILLLKKFTFNLFENWYKLSKSFIFNNRLNIL